MCGHILINNHKKWTMPAKMRCTDFFYSRSCFVTVLLQFSVVLKDSRLLLLDGKLEEEKIIRFIEQGRQRKECNFLFSSFNAFAYSVEFFFFLIHSLFSFLFLFFSFFCVQWSNEQFYTLLYSMSTVAIALWIFSKHFSAKLFIIILRSRYSAI